jgi:hypothetical protein
VAGPSGYADGVKVLPNVWLKRPERVRSFVGIAGGLTAFFLALAVGFILFTRNPGSGPEESIVGAVVWGLVPAGLCICFIARSRALGLLLSSEGIVIRGPFRTRKIPPSEAVRFKPEIFANTPGPVLELVSGQSIGIWALGREGVRWEFDQYLQEVEPLCNQLNQLMEKLYPEHPLPAFHEPSGSSR